MIDIDLFLQNLEDKLLTPGNQPQNIEDIPEVKYIYSKTLKQPPKHKNLINTAIGSFKDILANLNFKDRNDKALFYEDIQGLKRQKLVKFLEDILVKLTSAHESIDTSLDSKNASDLNSGNAYG